ncbi:MAG: AfsR/SARP family transcriptional regulator [Acidimicrobiales bacterium]
MEVGILGPLIVIRGASPVAVTAGKERGLITALALRPGTTSSAELVDMLWGTEPPASAAATLRGLVSRLRRLLGPDVLRSVSAGRAYRLDVPPAAVDATRFHTSVDAGRLALQRGDIAAADRAFAEALAEWRGEALIDLPESPTATGARTHLRELRLEATELRFEAALALGRGPELVGDLEAELAAHPLRERLWGQLMVALYRADRQTDALRAFQRARVVLVDELGIEPSEGLRELEAAILVQDPILRGASGIAPRDHGSASGRRGDGDSGPAASAVLAPEPVALPRSTARHSGNLPVQLTPFVGRHQDIAALRQLVRSQRLTTLVGTGGMGKTRLALEVAAAALDDLPDGSWLLDLAPITSPEGVDHTAIAAFGLEPRDALTNREIVGRALADWWALIVVDSCEHLLPAARSLVAHLLEHCPHVQVLATSREPLRIPGERVWELGPLDFEAEAVELFAERAGAVRHTFELTAALRPIVASICRQLDGMPLAIELAAARTRSMSPVELAERLDERFRVLRDHRAMAPPRHATLKAVVDWSFDLLSPEERQFLARLSVFPGDFDLAATHAVCADTHDEYLTLDALDALVERSLVVVDTRQRRARYRLLDTIRQYAAAHLDSATREATRLAHARYYAELVRRRRQPGDGHAPLPFEVDNLRAAVGYAVAWSDPALALGIAGRLWAQAFRELGLVEAEEWARTALALPGSEQEPDVVWAHVLVAVVRHLLADAVGCERHARLAISAQSRLGLPPHPRPLLVLSLGAGWQGKLDTAIRAASAAAQLAEGQGRTFDQMEALAYRIQWSGNAGRPPDVQLIRRCLDLAASTGSPIARIIAAYVAGIAWSADEPDRALVAFSEVHEIGAQANYQNLLVGLAGAHSTLLEHHHDPAAALRGLDDALRYFAEVRVPFGLRRLIRDYLPVFEDLACHEVVAILDGAAAPLSIRPVLAAHAVERARRAMAPAPYQAAAAVGRAMSDATLEDYLRAELHRLAPAP